VYTITNTIIASQLHQLDNDTAHQITQFLPYHCSAIKQNFFGLNVNEKW